MAETITTRHIVERIYGAQDSLFGALCTGYERQSTNGNGNSESLILYIIAAGLRTLGLQRNFTLSILDKIVREKHKPSVTL